MKDEILFTEVQRFKQWWMWLILLGPTGLVAYGVVTQVVLGNQFGDKPSGDVELLLVFALVLFVSFAMFSFRLETNIRKDGVYVKFFPFHLSFKRYSWEQIHSSYIRKYNSILEYGGWGFRGFGKNKVLNVSGNQGLQLELEDGKKLLIGTRRPEEITEVLRRLGQQGHQ